MIIILNHENSNWRTLMQLDDGFSCTNQLHIRCVLDTLPGLFSNRSWDARFSSVASWFQLHLSVLVHFHGLAQGSADYRTHFAETDNTAWHVFLHSEFACVRCDSILARHCFHGACFSIACLQRIRRRYYVLRFSISARHRLPHDSAHLDLRIAGWC